jgi:hypothetical protein
VLWEWIALVARSDHRTVLMTGGASLALAVALAATGHLLAAVIVLAISTLGVAALAPAKWRTWNVDRGRRALCRRARGCTGRSALG